MGNNWLMKSLGISELIGNTGAMAQKAAGRGVVGLESAMSRLFPSKSTGVSQSLARNSHILRGMGVAADSLGAYSRTGQIPGVGSAMSGIKNFYGAGGNKGYSAMRYGATGLGIAGAGYYLNNKRRR